MNTTSSHLPICVHCGTPRPADETLCPTCGKPWIDTTIQDVPVRQSGPTPRATPAGASNVEPDFAQDDTGEFSFDDWTLPPEPRRRVAVWLIPLLFVIAAGGVWAVTSLGTDATPEPTIAAAPSSLPPATIGTVAPPTTTPPQATTTVEQTTTTVAPTTTVPSFAQPSRWDVQSTPVDAAELTLRAEGIGPIDVGTPIEEAAGILTASLGEADAAGIDGLCQPQESYWLQWGRFKAIFNGDGAGAELVSYRYEISDTAVDDVELTTLSGVALGDSITDLQDTYKVYTVSFEIIGSTDYFRLSDGGQLLLWGPVTSTDPTGTITGIYSPSPCP